ncbi:WXG100 family type VII secretion target [Streptomyces litchfieldiae]|uniref:WXG100 family type VII secretion target n=1 Tax=Streptomyces litchfieldiae TaxID=3075543 RepID=A0ABU2MLS2_9ACTN|nr:WXG100 family type VII secretion target [Streptomyces sp. DSM 44938]MDT0342372.1 WXG100 family type VII secretion target [Streptomyces sp. DSM 44938]
MGREGDVDVTYQDMRDAGDRLIEAKEDFNTKFDQLKVYVADLVQDGYVTTRSSVAFDQAYEEFTTGGKQTMDSLQGLGDFLHGAADGFADLDRQLEEGLRE